MQLGATVQEGTALLANSEKTILERIRLVQQRDNLES
jgi:hypothetical protein